MNSSFPTLLNKRAKLFASMNRSDLMVTGAGYLVLSWTRISGITGLIIIGCSLFIFKLATRYFPKGFLKEINCEKVLKWCYKLEAVHE